MTQTPKIFMILLAALLLVCCVGSERTEIPPPGNGKLKLDYKVAEAAVTRGGTHPALPEEESLRSLHLLFFNVNTGIFAGFHSELPEEDETLPMNGTIQINFAPGSGLDNSTPYDILLVGNVEDYIEYPIEDWLASFASKTKAEVEATVYVRVEGAPNNSESDNSARLWPGNIPMSGEVFRSGNEDAVTAELTRIVSRFDITNKDNVYELVSVSIWNAYPNAPIWENNFRDYQSGRIKRYYGIPAEGNAVKGGLYAFENYSSIPEQNDKLTTCLIVGMEKGGNRYYYRININSKGFAHNLLRNNLYQLEINNVLGPGDGSEEDAYGSKKFLLDLSVNGWNIPESPNILIDGENILVIPTTLIPFPPEGDSREFTVFTHGDAILEVLPTELPPGITATLGHAGQLTVAATPSEDVKSGYFELKFGKLKGIVTVTQSSTDKEFLSLNVTTLPAFASAAGERSEEITVTSSGPWEAQIYNGGFEFESGGEELTGVDNDSFRIVTSGANATNKTTNSFLLLSLQSNLEVQRVLVLSQNGMGGISITPLPLAVEFDALGNAIGFTDGKAEFEVDTEGLPWTYSITGNNYTRFTVEKDPGGTKFTVNASNNAEKFEFTATVRISLGAAPAIYKDISVSQARHRLDVSPQYHPAIGYLGGSSGNITVTASGPWTATLNANTDKILFNNGSTMIRSTDCPEDQFRVVFGKNLNGNFQPAATLTVKLDGTNISEDFFISQSKGNVNDILHICTARYTGHGSLYNGYYIRRFYDNMNNQSYFGPGINATVWHGSWNNTYNDTGINNGTQIFCWNSGATLRGQMSRKWVEASPDRVLLFWGDLEVPVMANNLGLGHTGERVNVPAASYHTINPDVNFTVENNKIMNYLLKDGPFTNGVEIPKSSIQLRGYDDTNGALSLWPDTMVPIIMTPGRTGRLTLGIDPVQRVVFCGNTEIFQTGVGNTVTNFDSSATGQANQKFLNNLIAWIMNAARYGEAFLEDFRD